ncbi:hypothetical protein RFI_39206, partial [Reticulomyxa filosa]
IYVALNYWCEGNINQTFELLFEFEQWKFRDNNEQNYKKRINDFLERRCCNHNINLFCMFLSERYKKRTAVERAASYTVNDGLPFVNNGKKPLTSKSVSNLQSKKNLCVKLKKFYTNQQFFKQITLLKK